MTRTPNLLVENAVVLTLLLPFIFEKNCCHFCTKKKKYQPTEWIIFLVYYIYCKNNKQYQRFPGKVVSYFTDNTTEPLRRRSNYSYMFTKFQFFVDMNTKYLQCCSYSKLKVFRRALSSSLSNKIFPQFLLFKVRFLSTNQSKALSRDFFHFSNYTFTGTKNTSVISKIISQIKVPFLTPL